MAIHRGDRRHTLQRVRRIDDLIAERFAEWEYMPHAVSEVFPDPTPGAIGALVEEWCRRALGAEPAHAEFSRRASAASTGCASPMAAGSS
jgi:hypothetical protein